MLSTGAVLWDLDGTLIDPEQYHWLAWRDTMAGEGGLVPLPERLASGGWLQAIASSAPRENIDAVPAVIGLGFVFEIIVSAEDVRGKPDPQVFLTAAARLGSALGRSIVVEDAPAGVEAARRAGMPSIGVSRNGTPLPADLAVTSLADLPPDAFSRLLK